LSRRSNWRQCLRNRRRLTASMPRCLERSAASVRRRLLMCRLRQGRIQASAAWIPAGLRYIAGSLPSARPHVRGNCRTAIGQTAPFSRKFGRGGPRTLRLQPKALAVTTLSFPSLSRYPPATPQGPLVPWLNCAGMSAARRDGEQSPPSGFHRWRLSRKAGSCPSWSPPAGGSVRLGQAATGIRDRRRRRPALHPPARKPARDSARRPRKPAPDETTPAPP